MQLEVLQRDMVELFVPMEMFMLTIVLSMIIGLKIMVEQYIVMKKQIV
jgi:hypothetical protein